MSITVHFKELLLAALSILIMGLFCLPARASARNILLIGYWPPTNGMLREFSTNPAQNPGGWKGQDWEGSGLDVHAYFPEYPNGTGVGDVGVGDFRVDYASTFNDFMRVTTLLKPIAIIGFGNGAGPWEVETNFPITHYEQWLQAGQLPSTVGTTLAHPIPASLSAGGSRRSSLPVDEIAAAVLAETGVRAWVDRSSDAGSYLCGFLGLLSAWYHDTHSDPTGAHPSRAAGFIHVSGEVSMDDAIRSTHSTLRALIRSLSGAP